MRHRWTKASSRSTVSGRSSPLIFIALEIQQNTNAVRSGTVQEISRWSYDASLLAIERPEVIEARQAACNGSLTEDQRTLLSVYYAVILRVQINRFEQARLGIIDEEFALDLGGRGGAFRNPFFAEAWAGLRDEFSEGFGEFVERELIPLAQDGCRFGY